MAFEAMLGAGLSPSLAKATGTWWENRADCFSAGIYGKPDHLGVQALGLTSCKYLQSTQLHPSAMLSKHWAGC